MGYERTAWLGNVLLAAVMVFLAWVQVSAQLSRWTTIGIAAAVVLYVIAVYPWKKADGSAVRLIEKFQVNKIADQRPTMTAGDNSNQIVNEGGGTFNINNKKGS